MNNDSPVGLPPMDHTFSLNTTGVETKRNYDGQFTYSRPNLHKKAEIAKMKVRLNGDLKNLDFEVQAFNEMYATLFFGLTDAPQWWIDQNNGRDLYDINVIQEVYMKCMDFERDWNDKVWGDKKTDVQPKKSDEVKVD